MSVWKSDTERQGLHVRAFLPNCAEDFVEPIEREQSTLRFGGSTFSKSKATRMWDDVVLKSTLRCLVCSFASTKKSKPSNSPRANSTLRFRGSMFSQSKTAKMQTRAGHKSTLRFVVCLFPRTKKATPIKFTWNEINVTISWLYVFPIENNKNADTGGAEINVTICSLLIFPNENNKNIKIVTLGCV